MMALMSNAIRDRAVIKRLIKQSLNLLTLMKLKSYSSESTSSTSISRRPSHSQSYALLYRYRPIVETCNSSFITVRPVTSYSTSHRFSIPTQDDSVRKLKCVLDYWTGQLQPKDIDEPDISTYYIVAHVLGHKTIHDVDSNTILTKSQEEKIKELCQLRLRSHFLLHRLCSFWHPECLYELLYPCACKDILLSIYASAVCYWRMGFYELDFKNEATHIDRDRVLNELCKLSPFPLIVSNPPYLSTNEIQNLQPEIKW